MHTQVQVSECSHERVNQSSTHLWITRFGCIKQNGHTTRRYTLIDTRPKVRSTSQRGESHQLLHDRIRDRLLHQQTEGQTRIKFALVGWVTKLQAVVASRETRSIRAVDSNLATPELNFLVELLDDRAEIIQSTRQGVDVDRCHLSSTLLFGCWSTVSLRRTPDDGTIDTMSGQERFGISLQLHLALGCKWDA